MTASRDDASNPIGVRGYQIPTQLLRFLREYFQPAYPKFIIPLDRLEWPGIDGPATKTQNATAIEIFKLGEQSGEVTDLPKILIRREPVVDMTVGFNNGKRGFPSASNIHETRAVGSVTCFAMSRTLDEAEIIAFEVFEVFRQYSTKLRRKMCLKKFKANQVGSPGQLRAFPGFLAVPVSFDYAYFDNVRVSSNRVPIRELQLNLEVDD